MYIYFLRERVGIGDSDDKMLLGKGELEFRIEENGRNIEKWETLNENIFGKHLRFSFETTTLLQMPGTCAKTFFFI